MTQPVTQDIPMAAPDRAQRATHRVASTPGYNCAQRAVTIILLASLPLASAFYGAPGAVVRGARWGGSAAGAERSLGALFARAAAPMVLQGGTRPASPMALKMTAVEDSETATVPRLELTLGELAKTLVTTSQYGTLCSTLPIREDEEGVHRFGPDSPSSVDAWDKYGKEYPFGSLVSYLVNAQSQPYMLLANNAAHTRNIDSNNKVALYVQNPASPGQKGARVTMVGEISKITDERELKECKEFYADRFPDQAEPLEDERFGKFFSMYKMSVKDIYYVAGFGVMTTWVTPEDFIKAQGDPLASFSPELIATWNKKKLQDFQTLAVAFFGAGLGLDEVDSPRVTFLDRFGFNFRFRFPRKGSSPSPDGKIAYDIREYRIGFRQQAMSKEEAQSAMFKILQEAWEKTQGYDDDWGENVLPYMILKRATDLDLMQGDRMIKAQGKPSAVTDQPK